MAMWGQLHFWLNCLVPFFYHKAIAKGLTLSQHCCCRCSPLLTTFMRTVIKKKKSIVQLVLLATHLKNSTSVVSRKIKTTTIPFQWRNGNCRRTCINTSYSSSVFLHVCESLFVFPFFIVAVIHCLLCLQRHSLPLQQRHFSAGGK